MSSISGVAFGESGRIGALFFVVACRLLNTKLAGQAMEKRFEDTSEGVYSFTDETLVVCPHCSGCAVSRTIEATDQPGWFSPRRLTCRQCPYVKEWAERQISRGWYRASDDYFELPLWLQAPCCGEVLWAYNERHLSFLEDFVSADLRERTRDEKWGWSNGSLASRLPKWIKSAKNRDEVMKGLSRLRQRLRDAG